MPKYQVGDRVTITQEASDIREDARGQDGVIASIPETRMGIRRAGSTEEQSVELEPIYQVWVGAIVEEVTVKESDLTFA